MSQVQLKWRDFTLTLAVYQFGIFVCFYLVFIIFEAFDVNLFIRNQYGTLYTRMLSFLMVIVFIFSYSNTRNYLFPYLKTSVFKQKSIYFLILFAFTFNYFSQHIIYNYPYQIDFSPMVQIKGINNIFFLLFTVIIIPFVEEVIFRGFIFNFLDKKYNIWTGAIISSLYFGLIHYGTHFISALLIGLVYAYIFKRTQSLIPIIVCHILWNLYAFFY